MFPQEGERACGRESTNMVVGIRDNARRIINGQRDAAHHHQQYHQERREWRDIDLDELVFSPKPNNINHNRNVEQKRQAAATTTHHRQNEDQNAKCKCDCSGFSNNNNNNNQRGGGGGAKEQRQEVGGGGGGPVLDGMLGGIVYLFQWVVYIVCMPFKFMYEAVLNFWNSYNKNQKANEIDLEKVARGESIFSESQQRYSHGSGSGSQSGTITHDNFISAAEIVLIVASVAITFYLLYRLIRWIDSVLDLKDMFFCGLSWNWFFFGKAKNAKAKKSATSNGNGSTRTKDNTKMTTKRERADIFKW